MVLFVGLPGLHQFAYRSRWPTFGEEGVTMRVIGLIGTAIVAAASSALASGSELQSAEALKSVDISHCITVVAPQERLDCYDALGGQARRSSASLHTAGGAESPASTTEERVQIDATIASLRISRAGAWTITLSNGQVWQQMDLEKLDLKEGYSVRIYPSKWGPGFRLSAHEVKGFIQVTRTARP
jgi:hypothetical protein